MPTYYGPANNGKQLRLDISWTQSTAGNYSDVRSVLYIINNQWVADSTMQVGNVIEGQQLYWYSGYMEVPAGTILLADSSLRVYHTEAGTRSVSFAAGMSAVNTGYVSLAINVNNLTLPSIVRPPLTPYAPPSIKATRYSNSRVDLSWTTKYTDAAGRRPWTGVRIQRWSKRTGSWSTIATLSWSTTSYRDTGVSADNEYDYRIQSYNAAGNSSWTEASGTIKMTPAAPSGVTVSLSGANATVNWTNNALSQSGFYIDRWSKSSNTWTRVASVTSGVRSWTDTNVPLNNQYKYRVSSYIGSLLSSWTESSAYNTKPSAPTTVTASKTGSNIIVKWTNTAVNQTGAIIYDNGTQIGTVGVGVSQFTHASPNGTVTHTYTIRATVSPPSLQSDLSTPSNTVLLIGIPNAPADVQTSQLYYSVEDSPAFVLSWRHNPVDSSTQTAYQIRYRKNAGSWVTLTKVTSDEQTVTLGLETFPDPLNGMYEFQVTTWGAHATGSPYSVSALTYVENNPLVTVTSPPPGEVLNTNRVDVAWTYTQAQGRPQGTYTLTLFQGDDPVYTTTLASADSLVELPYTLLDNTEYVLEVEVLASNGLSSGVQAIPFGVSYAKPANPVIDGYFDTKTGAHMMSFVNPEGDIDALLNKVYRNIDPSSNWYGLENNLTPPEPAFNYVNNPRFMPSGDIEVYRNRIVTPRFELTSGTVEVRRNYITRPNIKLDTTGWNRPVSLNDTDTALGLLLEALETILPNTALLYRGNTEIPSAIGETWSGSFRVENRGTVDISVRARQYWNNAGTFSNGEVFDIAPGTSRTVTVTGTAPTGTTHVRLTLSTPDTPMPAGVEFRVSNAINEKSPVAGPYFDGSTQSVPDPDLAQAWAGTPLTSQSILTGQVPLAIDPYFVEPDSVAVIKSTGGAIRLIRKAEGVAGVMVPATLSGPTTAMITGTPELPPTVVPQILDGTLEMFEPLVEEEPGKYRAFTQATGWNGARFLILSFPEEVGSEYTYSLPVVHAGNYMGDYFDGGSTTDPDMVPSWSGAPDASESILTGQRVAGVTTTNCIAIQSTKFATPGSYSMRLIPTSLTSTGSFAELPIPVEVRGGGAFVATRHLEQPLTGEVSPYGLAVILPGGNTNSPNVAGSSTMRLPYGALTGLYTGYFYHGGKMGSGDVYWTEPGLYEPEYTGPYFDGSFGSWVEDGLAANASWLGEPNDSPSAITYDYPAFNASEWEYLGEFPLNASFSDYEGLTNGRTMYMVEAISEIPSSARAFYAIDTDSRWVWLSRYDGAGNAGAIPFNLSTTEGYVHPQSTVHHFDGRDRPVLISGKAVDHTIQITGTLDPTAFKGSTYEDLINIVSRPGPHIYRDKAGNRFFAKVDAFSSSETKRLRQVSFTVIEVERYGI